MSYSFRRSLGLAFLCLSLQTLTPTSGNTHVINTDVIVMEEKNIATQTDANENCERICKEKGMEWPKEIAEASWESGKCHCRKDCEHICKEKGMEPSQKTARKNSKCECHEIE